MQLIVGFFGLKKHSCPVRINLTDRSQYSCNNSGKLIIPIKKNVSKSRPALQTAFTDPLRRLSVVHLNGDSIFEGQDDRNGLPAFKYKVPEDALYIR